MLQTFDPRLGASLIGLSVNSPEIGSLLRWANIEMTEMTPALKSGEFEVRKAIYDKGVDLNFVPNQAGELVLGNLIYWGPEYSSKGYIFEGSALPLGLDFGMTHTDVESVLGVAGKTWQQGERIKSQRWVREGYSILIQYSKVAAGVRSIELSLL